MNIRDYVITNIFSTTASLSIHSTNITTLPESISEFQEIESIEISNTPITSLPDSIGNLQNLERILLSNTSISSLPESIGLLPLTTLHISNAPISSLPDSIGNINNLSLHLSNTRITALPNTVRNLSNLVSNPEIPLSPELREYIEGRNQIEWANVRRAMVQQYRHSRNNTERAQNRLRLANGTAIEVESSCFQSNIERLYSCIHKKPGEFIKIQNIPTLKEWLDRILFRVNREVLAPFIVEILEHGEKSDEFRERLALSIEASLGACDDRISLYINHIYIEKKLFSINRTNSSELIDFLLHTAFPISLIDEIAGQKSVAVGRDRGQEHYREEIETYLAYLIGLNSILSLGLPIKTMSFERISKVKPEDIDSAAKLIKDKMSSAKEYIPFLIEHPTWVEFLQITYPKEMNEIADKAIDIIDMYNKNSSDLMHSAEKAKTFRKNYLALLTQNHMNDLNSRNSK